MISTRISAALLRGALVSIATLGIAACSDSDSPSRAELRVIHASPDAPNVNVVVDGDTLLTNVAYKQGSAFESITAGEYDVAVDAVTPAGEVTVLELSGAELLRNREYSVLAIGRVANETLEALVIDNAREAVPAGQVRAQVVHAAPNVPGAVSVWVTAPGADLAGATALGDFSFGEELGPVEVPAGDYRIRVTAAGTISPVVYDSGTVALDAGTDLLIAAVQNTTTGPAPISLIANDGEATVEILDATTTAAVRAGHFSPDAPIVDVVANDNFASPLFNAVAYPSLTPYAEVPPASYNVKVVDDATQDFTAINADLTLVAGKRYSVLAVNLLSAIEPLVLEDDLRSVATEARVRIVHGSPGAGTVDIYVTAPETDINTVSPIFPAVAFKANTGYVSLPGGTYAVAVTPAGLKTPVAIAANLVVANGGVYNVVARDAAGGGAPFGLTVTDELD